MDTPSTWQVTSMSRDLDGDSVVAELIRVGPVYVTRGDEWASVVIAGNREAAIRRFHDDGCEAAKRQQQERHERSPLLGPPRPA